jgi:type II secretory pathway pseudopilin PulG
MSDSRTNLRRAGFSMVEVMLAVSVAMILLYGAIYSSSEMVAVVREGDVQMHTHVQARRVMDRLLKDARYSSDLTITGDPATGWEIEVLTTGSLAPGWVTYEWDPGTEILTITDGVSTEILLDDVREFEITQETEDIGGDILVTRLTLDWVMGLDEGAEAGAAGVSDERTLELAGSTLIRINDA